MKYDLVLSPQIPLTVPKDFGQNKPVCIITGKTVPSDVSDYDVHAKMDTHISEMATLAILIVLKLVQYVIVIMFSC